MLGLIANLFAVLATAPFLTFLIVFFFVRWKKQDQKMALRYAIHVTTFFLLFSVIVMSGLVEPSFAAGWWFIFFVVILGSLMVFLQFKLRGRVRPMKIVRGIWLLSFFLLSLAYIMLFIIGVVNYVQMG